MALQSKEFNDFTGAIETLAVEDGRLIDHTSIDVSDLIAQNKAAINSGANGWSHSRNYRQIAELDMATVARLKSAHNIDVFNPEDMPRLKKWLRSSENKYFRTVNGRF